MGTLEEKEIEAQNQAVALRGEIDAKEAANIDGVKIVKTTTQGRR